MHHIAQEILWLIQDMGDLAHDIVFTPYGKLRISGTSSKYEYHFKKLNKGKFIRFDKKTKTYSLTPRGQKSLESKGAPRQDGLITVLIFDVPCSMNSRRAALRRYIVKNGYEMLQRSVFTSRNLVTRELKELIDFLGLRNHIRFLSGRLDS